jgi:hypothetical protein
MLVETITLLLYSSLEFFVNAGLTLPENRRSQRKDPATGTGCKMKCMLEKRRRKYGINANPTIYILSTGKLFVNNYFLKLFITIAFSDFICHKSGCSPTTKDRDYRLLMR